MYYIYILYSEHTDSYYIGSTEDIDSRLQRHNAGATPSTKAGRPWRVVYRESYEHKGDAIRREKYIKRMKSRKYTESLFSKNPAG